MSTIADATREVLLDDPAPETVNARLDQASEAQATGDSLTYVVKHPVHATCTAATPDELAELEALATELPAAAERMAKMLDAVTAQLDHSLDPARDVEMHQRVAEDLQNDRSTIDWSKLGLQNG